MRAPIEVTKEFTFDTAHSLTFHEGKCRNLHGHTYKLQLSVVGTVVQDSEPDSGMIADFGIIKKIVEDNWLSKVDHGYIFSNNAISDGGFSRELLQLLEKYEMLSYFMTFEPTCENLVREIFNQLNIPFKIAGMEISEIKLWETPTSFATLRGGEFFENSNSRNF